MEIYICKFEKRELSGCQKIISTIRLYINADTKENATLQVIQIIRNNFDKFRMSDKNYNVDYITTETLDWLDTINNLSSDNDILRYVDCDEIGHKFSWDIVKANELYENIYSDFE
jgi:hypothetical protein